MADQPDRTDAPEVLAVNVVRDPSDGDRLFAQYQLAVELADRVTDRRQRTNVFFISVVSALTAFQVAAAEIFDDPGSNWGALTPAVTAVICVLWARLIQSYRSLNAAKFKVIHRIEDHLPAQLFSAEEKVYRAKSGWLWRHVELTRIEVWLPVLLAVLYVSLSAGILLTD